MIESTLTSKGQTTVPKEVREALGLKPGDRLRYFVSGDSVRVVRPKPVSALFGILKKHYDGPPISVEEMDEGIAEAVTDSYLRSIGALPDAEDEVVDADVLELVRSYHAMPEAQRRHLREFLRALGTAA